MTSIDPTESTASHHDASRLSPSFASVSTDAFDIVGTYHRLLASDDGLTKPIAAILSLIALLNTVPSATAHETVELVEHHSDLLKAASITDLVSLKAGTDLFTKYLVDSLRQQAGSFDAVRQRLLSNGELIAQRAIDQRNGVAEKAQNFIHQKQCVMTLGASRCVAALLARAAQSPHRRLGVVYVTHSVHSDKDKQMVESLRQKGIPVAEISFETVEHLWQSGNGRQIDAVIVGAEAVTSGGIITRTGTLSVARLALQTERIPFYVVAETHKFACTTVVDPTFLGPVKKLDFNTEGRGENFEDAKEYIKFSLITGLLTDMGLLTAENVNRRLKDDYGNIRSLSGEVNKILRK